MITGPVRGALEGEDRYVGKAYFFQGTQYWRYDLKNKDYGEVDYPQPLSEWKLPREFASGVDACLSGRGKYKGKGYFFKDGWYVSYDWKTNRLSERRSIAAWDLARNFPFLGGVDAALNGQGSYAGKAYFFRGEKYARFDWKTEKIDLVDRKLSEWHLGSDFDSNITACVGGDEGGLTSHPTAYFFKGERYVKYDWTEDRGLPGYPLPIAAGWPSGCAVWAGHSQAPTLVCSDPRLDGGKARLAYPSGSLSGQAGWQVSVKFTTIKDLADKLGSLTIPDYYGDEQAGKGLVPEGRITRLAINAHGGAGVFAANGPNARSVDAEQVTDMKVLTPGSLRDNLMRIPKMLAPGAPILLLGCQAGQRAVGGFLLMSLSTVFRDHPVTAFTTIGYAGGPKTARASEGCSEAGMRDTSYLQSSRGQQEENQRVAMHWGNLNEWPWASEVSARAKTALNGEIIRRPKLDYD
jgi:hypothetical protein